MNHCWNGNLRRTASLWSATKEEPCGRTCAQTARMFGRKVLSRARGPGFIVSVGCMVAFLSKGLFGFWLPRVVRVTT